MAGLKFTYKPLIDFKNKPTGVYKKTTGWVTDTDSRIELYYKDGVVKSILCELLKMNK